MSDGRYTFHANSLDITRASKTGPELVAHVAPSGLLGIDAIKTLVEDANKGLDSPVNEQWLSALHAICFDLGIPSGHIGQRVGQLSDKVRQLVDAQRSGREDVEHEADLQAKIAELEPWRTAVLRQCEGVDMTSKDPGDVVDALVQRIAKPGANLRTAVIHALEGHGVNVATQPSMGDAALIDLLCRAVRTDRSDDAQAYPAAMCKHVGSNWHQEGRPPEEIVRLFAEKIREKQPNPWRDAVQALLHRLGSSPVVPMFHDPQQATKMLADELQRVMLGRAREQVEHLLGQGFDELHDGIGKAESTSATDKIRRGLRALR